MEALCRGSTIRVVISSEVRSSFVLSRELEGAHWAFQPVVLPWDGPADQELNLDPDSSSAALGHVTLFGPGFCLSNGVATVSFL